MIQLKRFKLSNKIGKFVSFSKTIEFKQVISDTEYQMVEAALYSIVVHRGGSKSSGHYYAYVKGDDCCWRKFDDSCVREVNWEDVRREQAYILFYRKTKTLKKREFKNEIRSSMPLKSENAEEIVIANARLESKKKGIEPVDNKVKEVVHEASGRVQSGCNKNRGVVHYLKRIGRNLIKDTRPKVEEQQAETVEEEVVKTPAPSLSVGLQLLVSAYD